MTDTFDYDSYSPTRLAFHASRIVVDVGVLLVLAAMSLPFVSAGDFGQKAVAADALPALLLVLPIFVITLLPDQSRPVPSVLGWGALLLGATAAPYSIVKALDASTLAHTVAGRVGAGAWILVIGTFVVLAGIVYGLVRNLLHLPVAGTYPARPEPARPAPAPRASTAEPPASAARAPRPPAPPPRHLRRGSPTSAAPPAASHTPPTPRTGSPSAPPATRPPVRPRPADHDTEPTLPSVKPVHQWWPDDLENLFD